MSKQIRFRGDAEGLRPKGMLPNRMVRWIALPCAGAALALWSVTVLAGVSSIGSSFASSPNLMPQGLAKPTEVASLDPIKRETMLRQARASLMPDAGPSGKSARLATTALAPISAEAPRKRAGGFDQVVAGAALTPQKMAAAFARAGLVAKAPETTKARVAKLSPSARDASLPKATEERFARLPSQAVPVLERFARGGADEVQPDSPVLLAYADPSPFAASGALSDASVLENNGLVLQSPPEDDSEDSAALPGYEDTPDATPLPLRRPKADSGNRSDDSRRPDDTSRSDDNRRPADVKRSVDGKNKDDDRRSDKKRVGDARGGDDEERRATQSQRGAPSMFAFAKPDAPDKERGGGIFKSFRGTPKAGGGTAVYDISAKVVYMPDGSRLEAHSGIGAMADDPRYVHVKMKGATPPGTYNLVMREKRFHGVEAVRMLPANGKVAHNRDGILAHSYLLRGGRAESHGCVAFKDYNRFLTAFKKGKVTRIVVVPGGGKSRKPVQIASAARGA
ncbi:tlde1 domain-containing protein [Mesorhizobium sp. CN2-181]